MTKSAKLTLNGTEVEFPIRSGTLGQDVIDIAALGKTGHFTYDPGFTATASCDSKICFIDGGKGQLLYRGYTIEDLADKSNFVETVYLLLNGELPNQAELNQFNNQLNEHQQAPSVVEGVFNGFNKDAHPMAMLGAAVSALSAYYHDQSRINDKDYQYEAALHLVSQIPALSAMCYRHNEGLPFIAPRSDLNYAENFLNMMFGSAENGGKVNPIFADAMDKIFILHAEHEQNASTSTVRNVGSTGANPYASISAGIAALWGPAHGGANEAVVNMLLEIGDESHIEEYVAHAKDKDDSFRLMGFGHRVYKNFDPRAHVLRDACASVLDELGDSDNQLLKIAKKLETIALEDSYFVERKLYPNVDFYSGIILRALGIPTTMFTVLFALARTSGWVAHWIELANADNFRITRPRQLYLGYNQRPFKNMSQR